MDSNNTSGNKRRNTPDYIWFFDDYESDECERLQRSFDFVRPDLDQIGISTFVNLFDAHKDAFKVFIDKKVMPKTKNEVQYSWDTRNHSRRVLAAVEKCVSKLSDKDAFLDLVRRLAAVHATQGTKPSHILALLSCLRRTIFEQLEHVPQSKWLENIPSEKIQHPITTTDEQIKAAAKSVDDKSVISKAKNCHAEKSMMVKVRDSLVEDYDNMSEHEIAAVERKKTFASWDKFFMTLGLAMINGIERSRRRCSSSHLLDVKALRLALSASTDEPPQATSPESSNNKDDLHSPGGRNRSPSIQTTETMTNDTIDGGKNMKKTSCSSSNSVNSGDSN